MIRNRITYKQNSHISSLIREFEQVSSGRIDYLKSLSKPLIAWSSVYTPEEIIHAGGLIPFRITGEKCPGSTKSRSLMSETVCPYVLSCLEEGMQGIYDSLKGIVIVNTCDARRRLYDAWRLYVKTPFTHIIDLPKMSDSDSIDYFMREILLFKKDIEKHFKCEINKKSLEKSIKSYNETRHLLSQLYELRKKENPPISGTEILAIIKAVMVMDRGTFNKKLFDLVKILKSEDPKSLPKKQRILITGSYFDQQSLVYQIERLGAVVFCEDLSNGIKYFDGIVDTNEEPIRALAKHYFMKAPCARMIDSERRFKNILNLVKDYKADAVIYFSLKFCDSNLIDFPYQKNRLGEHGIPVLFVEGERALVNIGQLKTRIQAFLEMNENL